MPSTPPRGAARSFMLPDTFRGRAAALGTRLPPDVAVHLSDRPAALGAEAFAADGQVWIDPARFRPGTLQGLRLLGHELAHLGQQSGTARPSGRARVLADAALERAAEAFGAAFADAALLDAAWQAATESDPVPHGTVQCSGALSAEPTLSERVLRDAFADDDEEDEFGEFGLAPPPRGAPAVAASKIGTGLKVVEASRNVAAAGVSATQSIGSVLGGTGAIGHVTGAVVSGTAAALAPALLVLGPVGIAMTAIDVSLSAASLASTYSHIKALEKIVATYTNAPGVRDGTLEAIAFTLNKKNKKLKRMGAGCVPVLGSICNTTYTIGRTLQKKHAGTRGTERREYAHTLWVNMLAGDPAAIAACRNLLGEKVFGKISNCSDGDLVLKKKMRSL